MLQTETETERLLFQLDLSADVGEWSGPWESATDRELLGLVSSASIACGGHAGTEETMRRTAREALRLGVSIGAHPGYADRAGFGRRELGLSPEAIAGQVADQVGALVRCVEPEGGRVRYVKPHGALYNRAARDPDVALAISTAIREIDPSFALLGLAGSELLGAARSAGLRGVPEAFLDRGYQTDGSLVPRGHPGAVVAEPEAVGRRAVLLAREGAILTTSGTRIQVAAESCCVHSDSAGAAALLRAARAALERAGVRILPFCP